MNMKTLLVALIAISLTACAGGAKIQGNAGLTQWNLEFHEDGSLASVEVIDGKEKQNVRLIADIKNGTVDYSATGVLAFQAFTTRADVEKAIAEQWPALAGEASNLLSNIITKAIGIP